MKNKQGPFELDGADRVIAHLLLLMLCLLFLMPLIWMLATSLKPEAEIFAGTGAFSVRKIFSWPLHWQNYPEALQVLPFGSYLRNTLLLCILNVAGALASSSVVAYGFAKMEFKGRELCFWLMISTMALPSQVTMVPIFSLFRLLGWTGTYLPLFIPAFFGNPFYIFLLRQFFMTIPNDIAEAGQMDGAGDWRLFWQLHIPLAIPALSTCALFQFLSTWNDFFGPLLYSNDPSHYTVAYGLQQFISSYGSMWGPLMAAATIFTLPVIILFFFAQKTFIEGISTTGMKN